MFNLSKFNLQKALFKLVVILLPTQLVFRFWPEWTILHGIRIDYFSPSVYLVDIFVISYLVIQFLRTSEEVSFTNKKFLFAAGLIFINLVNTVVFANSAIYILRIIIYLLFVFFAAKSKIDYYYDFVKPLLFSVFFICVLSTFQFLLQKNVGGPLYFFGEREVSATSLAAPLFDFLGKEYLRAQSTFSHPNSFAGFVLISLILIGFTNFPKKDKWLKSSVFLIAAPGLLFSFSRSAFLSVVFVCVLLLLSKHSKSVFFKLYSILPVLFVVLSVLFLIISSNLVRRGAVYQESFSIRTELASVSKDIVFKNFLFGVGANNFIYELSNNPPVAKSVLFLQPVHNIYLLVFVEWGLVGLVFFVLLVIKVLLTNPEKLGPKIALLTILFLGMFDHYFLTLNQNILLFVFVLMFVSHKSSANKF